MKKHEKKHGLRPIQTITGKIKSLLYNSDIILDGFVLAGEKDSKIKFPPHLGKVLSPEIKAGGKVSVDVFAEDDDKPHLRFVSLETVSGTLHHTPPSTVARESAEEFAQAEGKIVDLALGKEKELNRVVLEDGTAIRVPPHARDAIDALLKINDRVQVTGVVKAIRPGEVALHSRLPLHLRTLEIGGKKYAV